MRRFDILQSYPKCYKITICYNDIVWRKQYRKRQEEAERSNHNINFY